MSNKDFLPRGGTPLVVIFLFAVIIRIVGLQWALPHHFHLDEDVMMYCAERIRTSESVHEMTDNIVFFIYSPVPLYWTAVGGVVIDAIHPIDGQDPATRIRLYTWARLLSALLGALTCIVVYFTGRTLHGESLGLASPWDAGMLQAVRSLRIRPTCWRI